MNIKYTIAYHAGCIDLVVPADAVGTWYNTPHDLEGKTIAIGDFGDSPYYTLIKILDHNGLDARTDVNIVVISHLDMPRVLEEGQIDAFISWEPIPLMAEQMGVGKIV